MLKFERMRLGGLTRKQEDISGPNCLLDGSSLTEDINWCQGGKYVLLL